MAAAAAPYRSQNWALTKPAARGRHGIVVSQSREAAEAGTAILEQGGNAADAALNSRINCRIFGKVHTGFTDAAVQLHVVATTIRQGDGAATDTAVQTETG